MTIIGQIEQVSSCNMVVMKKPKIFSCVSFQPITTSGYTSLHDYNKVDISLSHHNFAFLLMVVNIKF
jgi:hypothetical protein